MPMLSNTYLVVGICLLLSACAKNPLQTTPTAKVVALLDGACEIAMHELGFNQQRMNARFSHCMEHQAPSSFDCQKLYSTMAKILTEDGITINAHQITDAHLYARIRDELKLHTYL